MRTDRIAAFTLVLVSMLAGPANAQMAPVEINAGAGALLSWWSSFPGAHVQVGLPVGGRDSLELFVAAAPAERYVLGLIGGQMRHRLQKGDAIVRPFVTYGLSAGFVREGSRESYVSAPLIGLIGGGVERVINGHMIVRIDAQAITALVVPVGLRTAFSMSIPIGVRHARN